MIEYLIMLPASFSLLLQKSFAMVSFPVALHAADEVCLSVFCIEAACFAGSIDLDGMAALHDAARVVLKIRKL